MNHPHLPTPLASCQWITITWSLLSGQRAYQMKALVYSLLFNVALRRKNITVITGKGYYNRRDIQDTKDEGITVLVPNGGTSEFGKERFLQSPLLND